MEEEDKLQPSCLNRQSGMRRNKSYDLIALSMRKQNREMFSILSWCFIVKELECMPEMKSEVKGMIGVAGIEF